MDSPSRQTDTPLHPKSSESARDALPTPPLWTRTELSVLQSVSDMLMRNTDRSQRSDVRGALIRGRDRFEILSINGEIEVRGPMDV
jgi:hypothetical protein